MKLHDWLKKRTEFVKRANARHEERIGLGAAADEDIPYYAKVQDEMLMEIFEQLERIQDLYTPAPEIDETPESRAGHKFANRLRLG